MPFYGRKRIELGARSLWNAALGGGGPATGDGIQMETGEFLLLEDGSFLLLE